MTAVKLHLSFNATDVARSARFYRALLAAEPMLARDDYAKFELDEPPLVLSLVQAHGGTGGPLNHAGLRVADGMALVEAQARLEAAGYATEREENVACCHSRQTKFWARDPDGALWEVYILHAAEDESRLNCDSAAPSSTIQLQLAEPPRDAWLHRLTDAIPKSLPGATSSLDLVRLEGTLNKSLSPEARSAFLREVLRVLRPGGQVIIHGLASDRPLAHCPRLPGPAALVEHVPTEEEIRSALAEAGFNRIEQTQRGASPCFVVEGAELREVRFSAAP